MKIGITERGDAAIHFNQWLSKIDTVDGIVLVTKNPVVMLDRFNDIPWNKCILHAVITGFGGTTIEPNVPTIDKTLPAYVKLAEKLGGERVVLRIDPIFPTKESIKNAVLISQVAYKLNGRIRISILDMYDHIKDKFTGDIHSAYNGNLHANLNLRKLIVAEFPRAEVCGEPGIACTGCISKRDLDVMGLIAPKAGKSKQRASCACLSVKTELLTRRHPCPHGCIYCYWKK